MRTGEIKPAEINSTTRDGVKFFENFFIEYYEVILKYAKKVVKYDDAAEDIVLEVFSKMYSHARSNYNLYSEEYLLLLTRNACSDYFIHANKMKKSMALYRLSVEDEESWTYAELLKAGRLAWLNRQIEALPEQHRQMIRLYLNGMTVKEVASHLGISLKTAQLRIRIVIGILRKYLTER